MKHHEQDPGEAWANALLEENSVPTPARPRAGAPMPTASPWPARAPARKGRTWAMTDCVLSLLLGTPIAVQAAGEGDPVEGGARNPDTNEQLALERETEIIADTGVDSYGTRQSNKGAGGGAIYGCRSTLDLQDIGDPALSTPCIRANNLNDGKAFDLQVTNENLGGVIQKTNDIREFFPNAAPFLTNMGGIALGLNSDRVDNLNAEQIIAQAVERATGGGGNGEGDGGGGAGANDPNGGGGGDSGACPAGTTPVGDGCLETAVREAADFETAAATCEQAGRRLAPVDVLIAVRGTEAFDLADGEMSDSLTTPLALDLNQALAPLLELVSTIPLVGEDLELDPATIAAGYTVVPETGTPGGNPLPEPEPYRCWIA
jgi:hypothetical protein